MHKLRKALAGMASAMLLATMVGAAEPAPDPKLAATVNAAHRSAENKARDAARHPLETLTFFGLRPSMTVVELWPYGGWYTEILAPYLREGGGKLYAAADAPADRDEVDADSGLHRMFSARPDLYGGVEVVLLKPRNRRLAPDGTADMVLTFRNIHNWVWAGVEKDIFAAAFRALKPGGILGVEEHRAKDPKSKPARGEAYVGEDYAIGLIEAVGFKLAGKAEINANPRDTKDYPRGVWTLPPGYAEGSKDRAKYTAIGESDRFTLKFVKPK